jgi:hypothetical protein
MPKTEAKDSSCLTIEETKDAVTSRVLEFHQKGWLPSGAAMLVFGSMVYRPKSVYADSDTKLKFVDWYSSYDPFSGENLAGTACYQYRENKFKDERFPKENSNEFPEFVLQMEKLGKYLQELFHQWGYIKLKDFLSNLDTQYWKK